MSKLLSAIRQQLRTLNSQTQYTSIHVQNIVALLKALQSDQNYPEAQLAMRIDKSARRDGNKNVYILMKWLITLHEVIQQAQHIYAIEKAVNLVNSILLLEGEKKYSKYVSEKLVKPYRQYLNKLAYLLTLKKQGKSEVRIEQDQAYCEFNLMSFAFGELSSSVQQFSGFFRSFFPCLNAYLYLIGRDMSSFYKHLKYVYKKKAINNLTHFEIEQLGHNVDLFRRHKIDKFNSWVDIDTDADSEEASERPKQELLKERNQNYTEAIEGKKEPSQDLEDNWGTAISIIDKYGL